MVSIYERKNFFRSPKALNLVLLSENVTHLMCNSILFYPPLFIDLNLISACGETFLQF